MALSIACDTPQERVAKQAQEQQEANDYALANPPDLTGIDCNDWMLTPSERLSMRKAMVYSTANVLNLTEGTSHYYMYWCNAPYDDLIEIERKCELTKRRPC